MTFRDAAARHLREATKRSIGRDVYALEHLVVRVLAPSGSGSGCKGLSLKALRESMWLFAVSLIGERAERSAGYGSRSGDALNAEVGPA